MPFRSPNSASRALRAAGIGALLMLGTGVSGGEPRGTAGLDERAPPSPRTEYELKAYFLVNFARFVDWPDEGDPDGVLAIGVLGRDPFGAALDAYTGQLVKGRKIVVRRSRELRDLPDCRVLYLGESGEELARDLRALRTRSVLTFGDSEEFLSGGGIVRFHMEDKKVRMQVNRRAYTEARLRISSHLLAITTVVN